jgi:hypothetical protein
MSETLTIAGKPRRWLRPTTGAKESKRRWREENREKHLAHRKIEAAIRAGRLKVEPCVFCGCEAQAHHEDYSKPFVIVWLCPTHHKRRHKDINSGSAKSLSHFEVTCDPLRSDIATSHMHHIRLRPSGSWQVAVSHKRTRKFASFATLDAAMTARDAWIAELGREIEVVSQ